MSEVRPSILGNCRIDVGSTSITPATPHLFALLLLLSVGENAFTRSELIGFLFPDNLAISDARHRLRQLLYRLRMIGVAVTERPIGLSLQFPPVGGPLAAFHQMSASERSALEAGDLQVLPSYSPMHNRRFAVWLDDLRVTLEDSIHSRLLSDLRAHYESRDWPIACALGAILKDLSVYSVEVASIRTESLFMLGKRTEAIDDAEHFIRAHEDYPEMVAPMRQLRARIARSHAIPGGGAFVGRVSELQHLATEWRRSVLSGPRVTLLRGSAGIGKTRLAEEHSLYVALNGGHCVRYRCDEHSRQQPLALFSRILTELRSLRGSIGADPRYVPQLDRLVPRESPHLSPSRGAPVEALRLDIQHGLIDLFDAITTERPLLLLIDDAQHLDSASQAVVRALVTATVRARLHIVACCRVSTDALPTLGTLASGTLVDLAPLSRNESEVLLRSLRPDLSTDSPHLMWCLTQSAGNPYFIHTLGAQSAGPSARVPLDITSLAASAYAALSPSERHVLDIILLLGSLATVERVKRIAQDSPTDLIASLRVLETSDLVHYTDGRLEGPHALLSDSLRLLIPSSVAAALNWQIAETLEAECVVDRYDVSLAWISAQHWLSAGNSSAAVQLLRRCASHAASVGEPAAAAKLLSQVSLTTLPLGIQAGLLDDLIKHANAGGSRQTAATALRTRLSVSRLLGEPDNDKRSLELRIIEADLLNGAALAPAVAPLLKLLNDRLAEASLRAQAAVKLMVFADVAFDEGLATAVNESLDSIYQERGHSDINVLRAKLVFHTSFGDTHQARCLARSILEAFPSPQLAEICTNSRNFVAFSLYRMRESQQAAELSEANYWFMIAQGHPGEALYSASLRTEIAITDGDFAAAELWLDRSQAASGGVPPHQLSPNAGYHANAGVLAMMQGNYAAAREYFTAPQRDYSLLTAPRYRAISLALLLRLRQRSDGLNLEHSVIAELTALYLKGRDHGNQDTIVEALWCAHVLAGNSIAASQLLRDYLAHHRRESGQPEYLLRHSTMADEAWLEFQEF